MPLRGLGLPFPCAQAEPVYTTTTDLLTHVGLSLWEGNEKKLALWSSILAITVGQREPVVLQVRV